MSLDSSFPIGKSSNEKAPISQDPLRDAYYGEKERKLVPSAETLDNYLRNERLSGPMRTAAINRLLARLEEARKFLEEKAQS